MSAWESCESRVEANTDRLLDLFAAREAKATFFVLGWIAERHPALVRRIASAGHELGSHGFCHIRVDAQTPEEFREDVRKSRAILEDIAGVRVARLPRRHVQCRARHALGLAHPRGGGLRLQFQRLPGCTRLLRVPGRTADARTGRKGRFHFSRFPSPRSASPTATGPAAAADTSASSLRGIARGDRARQPRRRARRSSTSIPGSWIPDQPRACGVPAKSRLRHYPNLSQDGGTA